MLHGEKQRILLVLLLVAVLCMCLSLRLLCVSVLYELHTQHPVSLAVLRGIWLSRCSKENPLFPLQDASVSGEKCYCIFALQAHTSGPAAKLCIFFIYITSALVDFASPCSSLSFKNLFYLISVGNTAAEM